MFELSVALKYLIPRRRQLSVSIISTISILVITLVVWLLVVFFSVTHGLEKSWIQKLIALTAPVRVIPTQDYYHSYYYLADKISFNANYTLQSIGEKRASSITDPHDPEFDEEIPEDWPQPDVDASGRPKDLVKLAFSSIQGIPDVAGIEAKDFEMAAANLSITLNRDKYQQERNAPLSITQATYISSYDSTNPNLPKAMLPVDHREAENLIGMMGLGSRRKALENLLFHKKLPAVLPHDPLIGEVILLPKSYREAGARVGDRGYLSYQIPSLSTIQEQTVPIVIAGFYDPGIFPLGSKIILANQETTAMIRSAYPQEEMGLSNGINVRFPRIEQAELVKEKIQQAFRKAGINRYWNVQTYRDYEFTRDFLQQLRSERNLFTLIALVIIIVACSNIISMLIILVNDKKTEIGILRSMGASPKSIAAIFGLCGMVMGIAGSLLGTAAALFTLHHLQFLIDLISKVQGFDAFNPLFFGETLPNEVSMQALGFVVITTSLLSLIAGIVPAVKACLVHPSTILRSE